MNILCLGDNVCLGARSTRGWPEHLWEVSGAHVVNGANRGACMLDVVRAVPVAPDVRGGWDHVVIQAGSYDARGGGPHPEEFALLVCQAVDSVQVRFPGARIWACTPTPIEPTCRYRGFGRAARRWISRATLELRRTDLSPATLIDLNDLPPGWTRDGVHPSNIGARLLAERVWAALSAPVGGAGASGAPGPRP